MNTKNKIEIFYRAIQDRKIREFAMKYKIEK